MYYSDAVTIKRSYAIKLNWLLELASNSAFEITGYFSAHLFIPSLSNLLIMVILVLHLKLTDHLVIVKHY